MPMLPKLIHIRRTGQIVRPVMFTLCGKRVSFLATVRDNPNDATCPQCAIKWLTQPDALANFHPPHVKPIQVWDDMGGSR